MKSILVACLCSLLATAALAQKGVLDQANQLELQGHFKEAAAALTKTLDDKSLPVADRHQFAFELDRLERIRKDFPLTKDGLFAELKDSVKDLTAQEYERWLAEGRFESREIDGQQYFANTSVSNLYFRYPDLGPRRMPLGDSAALQKARLESVTAIRKAALAEKQPYVLPKRFHVTMTVTAKPTAAPPGEIIRAWLPIPRYYPFQDDFKLISSSPSASSIDSKDSPIRSVYLERPAAKDARTPFTIEYEYTAYGVSFDIKPESVRPYAPDDAAAVGQFIQEAPHVVFTPEMRALSQKIVGDETNPCLKAKKCFDWVAENIKYSFALEYSTLRNISDYCRAKRYGDCGQEALLFITLARLNGVPARWQTGWNTFPGDKDIHDWSEIYLAPYGWVPVDPYMGVWVMHYATTLTAEQRRQIRDFYFGGLDQYRIAANSDHAQTLRPPKRSMRSDNVDFQRGELECGDKNIYFDQYSYNLTLKEVKLPHAEPKAKAKALTTTTAGAVQTP